MHSGTGPVPLRQKPSGCGSTFTRPPTTRIYNLPLSAFLPILSLTSPTAMVRISKPPASSFSTSRIITLYFAVSTNRRSAKKGILYGFFLCCPVSMTSHWKGLLYGEECGSGSESGSTCFGPPGSGSGSFYYHAKIARKTLIPTIL
jgi:hypothetical protein